MSESPKVPRRARACCVCEKKFETKQAYYSLLDPVSFARQDFCSSCFVLPKDSSVMFWTGIIAQKAYEVPDEMMEKLCEYDRVGFCEPYMKAALRWCVRKKLVRRMGVTQGAQIYETLAGDCLSLPSVP